MTHCLLSIPEKQSVRFSTNSDTNDSEFLGTHEKFPALHV